MCVMFEIFIFTTQCTFSWQTHLLNPTLTELTLKFYVATASWLNQVALAGDEYQEMTVFRDVTTKLPTRVSFSAIDFHHSGVMQNLLDRPISDDINQTS